MVNIGEKTEYIFRGGAEDGGWREKFICLLIWWTNKCFQYLLRINLSSLCNRQLRKGIPLPGGVMQFFVRRIRTGRRPVRMRGPGSMRAAGAGVVAAEIFSAAFPNP